MAMWLRSDATKRLGISPPNWSYSLPSRPDSRRMMRWPICGKPRPLMKQVGAHTIKYILCRDGDTTPYCCGERDLLPSGKEPFEIGEVKTE